MVIIYIYFYRYVSRCYVLKKAYFIIIHLADVEFLLSLFKYKTFNHEEINRLFLYYSINFFFFYPRPPPSFL